MFEFKLFFYGERCDASSPYIHPVGFCEEAKLTLTTPAGKLKKKNHCFKMVAATTNQHWNSVFKYLFPLRI